MLTSRVLRSCLFAVFMLPACGSDREPVNPVAHHESSPAQEPAPVSEPTLGVPPPATVAVAPPPVARAIPGTYDAALAQGKALAAQGDGVGARELLEAAAKLDRKAAAPHIELARLFIGGGERSLAMTAASKAVKLAPDSSQAWNTLGRAQLARFSYDEAVTAFGKAIELDATNAWAWNNLGFAQLEQKHFAEAADALAHATSLPGATGYMWNNLGTADEQLGQLDAARAAFAAGGKLGSGPAVASAKRLVGVAAVVAVRRAEPVMEAAGAVHEYETREPIPAPDTRDVLVPPDAAIEIAPTAVEPAPEAGVDPVAPVTQTL